MAFTPEEIEYYHNRGLMPDWAYYQQNGKSAQENYAEQHRKMQEEYYKREKAKELEEAKKKIEQQILEAIIFTMEQGAGTVADAAAADIISSINAAFGGGGSSGKQLGSKSFSAELGVMLGRALGQAPFKLLDEIFKDDDRRKR